MKTILEVRPQGSCGGVLQAIRKVRKLREEKPEAKITILGSLVHNRYVMKALEDMNIHVLEAAGKTRLELLDSIDGGIVVFTAHGVSDQVRQKAKEKGLEVLDASCPFVLSTQKLVRQKAENGTTIFYIGKNGHPESEAIYTAWPQVVLIEKEEDIPDGITTPVFVTNQTTMSVLEIQNLFDAIVRKYPQAEIHDEICNATRIRQQAILDLTGSEIPAENRPDLLIVVGDPSSNNTAKLADTGSKAGIPKILRIESAQELDLSETEGCQVIAVTSGASTPSILTAQVIEKLKTGTEPEDFEIRQALD